MREEDQVRADSNEANNPGRSTFRLRRTEPSEARNLGRMLLALLALVTLGGADTDGSRWEVVETDATGTERTVFSHKDRLVAERKLAELRSTQGAGNRRWPGIP